MTTSTFADNTAIPTYARGKIRAFIKSRPEWNGWALAANIDSREAKNRDLLVFADQHGYRNEVLQIIAGNPAPVILANAIANLPTTASDSRWEVPAAEVEAADDAAIDAIINDANLVAEVTEKGAAMFDAAAAAAVDAIEAAGGFTPDGLLAEVDQFLSPYVKGKLLDALQGLIAAANKPPVEVVREVEVIREVQVGALPVAPEGALPFATKGKQVDMAKLFGMDATLVPSAKVTLWDSAGAAPRVDPFYVVTGINMALLATALERGSNVWLGGPGGSGKSTMPEQFCAYTGRPFTKLTFTRQTNVEDLVGGTAMKEAGVTSWEDGALVQAMRRPGMVILLDELTHAPAGVQAIIQGVADGHRSLTLPTGEVVKCAPGVAFVVADNTFGFGDETGLYAGVNQANAALVNRFGRMIRVTYMSEAEEARALANHTGAPLAACEHVAAFMARARRMPEMENVVLSLRQMVAFVQGVQDGFNPLIVAEVAYLNQLPATERAALQTLFTLTWALEFTDLLTGKPLAPVQAPVQGASTSPAGRAFDDEVSAGLSR
jgi:MoxR-like ATPase